MTRDFFDPGSVGKNSELRSGNHPGSATLWIRIYSLRFRDQPRTTGFRPTLIYKAGNESTFFVGPCVLQNYDNI